MAYIRLFRALWHYAGRGRRWKIILYMILHMLSHASTLAEPFVLAQILNTLQKQTGDVLETVLFWLGVWVGLFIWHNLMHRVAQQFLFDVAYRAQQAYYNAYYQAVMKLPLKWHADHHSGETINRINTAAQALRRFGANQDFYIEFFMLFWGPLVVLALLSWQVSLMAFCVAVAGIVIMRLFDRVLVELFREVNEIHHKISSVFYDYVSNARTIITLRLVRRTGEEFDRQIDAGYRPYIASEAKVSQWKWFFVTLSILVLKAGVVFYYIWQQVGTGRAILVGNVAAVFQYLGQVSGAYMNIAVHYQDIIAWHTDYKTAQPILDALAAQAREQETERVKDWRRAVISELDFAHESGRATLSGLSFSLERGEKIALIGESGAGKSTLMGLLRGLARPDRVRLDLDGSTYNSLTPLHAMTTLIPQDPEVFENTIRFNITMGIETPEDELQAAIRLARFAHVVQELPGGLESDVREKGVSLSGGERQRLALARGILAARHSDILLMDEPTSSVDTQNEMEIYRNLFAHFPDRTVIASVHRLNLLPLFDRVVVMDEGRIVQSGPFDALRQEDGILRELWEGFETGQTPR